MRTYGFLLLWLFTVNVGAFETWCGKCYEPLSPRTPPPFQTKFRYPSKAETPLLEFGCTSLKSIHIEGEISASFVIDLTVGYEVGSQFDHIADEGTVIITISHDVHKAHLGSAPIAIGSKTSILDFSLDGIKPSLKPYDITCSFQIEDGLYEKQTELLHLPKKDKGSAVRLDRLTGGIEVKRNMDSKWESILPFGFYDSFNPDEGSSSWWNGAAQESLIDNFGQHTGMTNREYLHRAKDMGFNIIHPVPPSTTYNGSHGSSTSIEGYLQAANELDIGVMYDTRHGFTDLSIVAEAVERYKSHPSIWIWYIADEPDGPSVPLDSTEKAKNLIRSLDPYHPTALVLNCFDYNFASYVKGTDILLVDVYHIAVNTGFSKRWSTPVTSTFGCSGCDGCIGAFTDLSDRIDTWSSRLEIMGKKRDIPIWVVPQAFDDHGDEFWWRRPEGKEVAVQTVLAVNHGVLGHCAWLASSAGPDILSNSSLVAKMLYSVKHFIVDRSFTRRKLETDLPVDGLNGIDLAAWTRFDHLGNEETLILGVMTHYISHSAVVTCSPTGVRGQIKEVLGGDVSSTLDGAIVLRMGRISIVGVIVSQARRDSVGIPQNSTAEQVILGINGKSEL